MNAQSHFVLECHLTQLTLVPESEIKSNNQQPDPGPDPLKYHPKHGISVKKLSISEQIHHNPKHKK